MQPHADAQSEQIFKFLVARSALTMHAPAHAVGVITPQLEECNVQAEVRRVPATVNAVPDSARNGSARAPRPMQPAVPADLPLTPAPDSLAQTARPRKALLLVGSARQMPSMSNSLGTYLLERLQERGIATRTIFLHRSLWNDRSRKALLDAVDTADVLVLAFPVYVDSLPYLVTRTLELLADHRGQRSQAAAPRLLCITNSGLPEVSHTRTALAICRRFALEAGFPWAGGLALGGGQAVRPGIFTFNTSAAPLLGQAPAWAGDIKRSLDLVGAALAEGKPAPEEALALMAAPLIPPWAYRLIGSMNWYREAWKRGTLRRLDARPYQPGGRPDATAAFPSRWPTSRRVRP